MSSSSKFHQSAEWKEIRAKFLATLSEYTCQMCGKPDLVGMDCHVDHIKAGHLGNGEFYYDNDFDNLQVLCSKCNGKKKDIKSFGRTRIDWKSNQWL